VYVLACLAAASPSRRAALAASEESNQKRDGGKRDNRIFWSLNAWGQAKLAEAPARVTERLAGSIKIGYR
jgi:hypothetical protein